MKQTNKQTNKQTKVEEELVGFATGVFPFPFAEGMRIVRSGFQAAIYLQ
jgi:hypothetical protein